MSKSKSVILTCVYCGHEYPSGTPASGAQILTDHIRVCGKHPMRKLEQDFKKVRDALVGLVGVSVPAELDTMESFIRLGQMPESDRTATINAICALRDTL